MLIGINWQINIYLIILMLISLCLIFTLALASILACAALAAKNIFIKILLLNTATSIASLFICFLGSFRLNSSYIDIALIYFLLSAIATSAYLKYFMQKTQQDNEQHTKSRIKQPVHQPKQQIP